VFIGEQKAEVLFAGLAPGYPGVYQVNVRAATLWTDRIYLREGGSATSRGWEFALVRMWSGSSRPRFSGSSFLRRRIRPLALRDLSS
jgi:hypothetical protein